MKTHQTHTPSLDETNIHRAPREQDRTEVTKERLHSVNPADETIVGEAELTPPDPAAEFVERAREAQQAWQRRPLAKRVQRSRNLFHELLGWRKELLELLVDETGKNNLEARWELWKTCEEVSDILADADEQLGSETKGSRWTPGSRTESQWQPRGVVLVVASGYDPMHTTIAPAIAALAAGNAVIVVADHRAPLVVQSLTNIATSTGIADALWTGLVGGEKLIDTLAGRVDAVVSYGSPKLTRRIARRQATRMIPVLGRWTTRDAMIVLNDAPLEKAARAAVCAACGGGGRRRRSLRRIYVQDSVFDPFVDAVVEEVGTLKQGGNGRDEAMKVGPLFDRQELETMERLVNEASEAGARLVAGGRARPRCRGSFFEPTVLTGVDESMRLWQESAPGPVVAMARIQAPAEAVRRTCDGGGYGAVSIYTGNRGVATHLAGRLQAPVVGINEVVSDVPASAPTTSSTFHGPSDPVGADRLRALSRRIITVDRGWSAFPHVLETRTPRRMERTLDAAIDLVHRRGWVQKAVDMIVPGR